MRWVTKKPPAILMLAMRLDRENTTAAELSKNLAGGGKLPVSDGQERLKALQNVRRNVETLSKTDRLSEARVLEVYLKDVLVGLNNDSPIAASHRENHNRWDGVVAPYVNKSTEQKRPDPDSDNHLSPEQPDTSNGDADMPDSSLENEDEPNLTDSDQSQQQLQFTKWTKQSSAIKTPLFLVKMVDDKPIRIEKMVTMFTKISPRVKLESKLILELKPWKKPEEVDSFKSKLDPMMKSEFGEYESVKVEVTTEGILSDKSKNNVSLPLCLQLHASKVNIPIRDGIVVMGQLSGKTIKRNSRFWQQLKLLRKSEANDQRLLIPFNAEPDLKQLVALEEEDFFVRNEVIIVMNLDEAIDLLSESNNADINEASEEFARIQQMIGSKSVGPFAVNKKIRAKLESILIKNPNHLSAKMILLRGDVGRSKNLDSYFVADELSRLLEKTSSLNEKQEDGINGGSLVKIAKEIEEVIEELEPFISAEDRKLTAHLTEIAGYLEDISRAKEKQSKRESIAVSRTITAALNNFKIKYLEAKAQLDEIMSKPPTI